jgi:hypothetical protein
MMAGHQGQAAFEDQGRKRFVCDWCPVVRIKGIRVGHPHAVQHRESAYLFMPKQPRKC